MSLKFPEDARCLIHGCTKTPTHVLSLRMRRQDSGADWAPNTEAYFCTKHAVEGALIEVLYTPNLTRTIEIAVSAPMRKVTRLTSIRD